MRRFINYCSANVLLPDEKINIDKYALQCIYYIMWNIDYSEEYDTWFNTLDEESKIAVLERVKLLQEFGPQLPLGEKYHLK